MTEIDFGDYTDRVDKYLVRSLDDILMSEPRNVAFYGGTFDPVHLAHTGTMKGALVNHADLIVVCPHSHNPNKAPTLIHDRITMLAIALDSPQQYRIAHPDFLDGIQNEAFVKLAMNLQDRKIKPWILCGADAVHKRAGGRSAQELPTSLRKG